MNQYQPRMRHTSLPRSLPPTNAATPAIAPQAASAHGHCFGSLSVLPPQSVPRESVQRDDDPAAGQTDTPDAVVPMSGGAVALGGGGQVSKGSTTIQAPTMQNTVVHGATLTDVSNALGTEPGAVDFSIDVGGTQGDPITSAVVTVTQTMTLPQWAERGTQCAPVQASWDTFLSALRNHEDGHVAIDNKRLANIHRRFVGVAVSGIQAKTDTVTAEVQAVQDAYDTANHHGTTQTPPTILDTSPTCPAAAAP